MRMQLEHYQCPVCKSSPVWVRVLDFVLIAREDNMHKVYDRKRVYYCSKCNRKIENIPQNIVGLPNI